MNANKAILRRSKAFSLVLWDNYPPTQRKWLKVLKNALKSNVSNQSIKVMATIYKAHGEVIEIEPRNGKDFKLSELQAIVSGYIEIVYLPENKIMVVNEEGKLNGLAINHNATRIFNEAFLPQFYDIICGDVLVCDSKQVK